jgi:hypothetical protein
VLGFAGQIAVSFATFWKSDKVRAMLAVKLLLCADLLHSTTS